MRYDEEHAEHDKMWYVEVAERVQREVDYAMCGKDCL